MNFSERKGSTESPRLVDGTERVSELKTCRITKSSFIYSSIQRVFDACDNPKALVIYLPSVINVVVSRQTHSVGDKFTVTWSFLGAHFDECFTYISYQKPLRIRSEFQGDFVGFMEIKLASEGDGVKAIFDCRYEMPSNILGRAFDKLLARRRLERDAERFLQNLKIVCEAT